MEIEEQYVVSVLETSGNLSRRGLVIPENAKEIENLSS